MQQNVRATEAGKAMAEANGELAAATYQRFETLFERRSVSQQEFEEVRAKHKAALAEVQRSKDSVEALLARENQVRARIDHDQAKADIESAKVYLGYARITSPMTGIVTARQAELGALAAPGVPLFTVEDGSRYRLEASVGESKIGNISKGEVVAVRLDVLDDRELQGKVAEIVPAADPVSRTYTVKVDIEPGAEGASAQLRSGLFGRARFPMGQKEVLSVPRSAVVERGQLVGLYTVDDQGVARFRLVKPGTERQGRVEVLSGLSPGEQFVVEGVERLADGNRVRGATGRQER